MGNQKNNNNTGNGWYNPDQRPDARGEVRSMSNSQNSFMIHPVLQVNLYLPNLDLVCLLKL